MEYFRGKIKAVTKNNKFDIGDPEAFNIEYDDGERETNVRRMYIRKIGGRTPSSTLRMDADFEVQIVHLDVSEFNIP